MPIFQHTFFAHRLLLLRRFRRLFEPLQAMLLAFFIALFATKQRLVVEPSMLCTQVTIPTYINQMLCQLLITHGAEAVGVGHLILCNRCNHIGKWANCVVFFNFAPIKCVIWASLSTVVHNHSPFGGCGIGCQCVTSPGSLRYIALCQMPSFEIKPSRTVGNGSSPGICTKTGTNGSGNLSLTEIRSCTVTPLSSR